MSQSLLAKIKKTKALILDLIFPKFCLGCQIEDEWLCSECRRKIVKVKSQVCPECARISPKGRFCHRHRDADLKGIVVSCYYDEGPVKELIHNFKYNHILEIKNILAPLMVEAFSENFLAKNLLITAVPLHFLRKAQRGYNQAELLAKTIAENFKIEKNFQILAKIHYTKPQVKTEGKKRLKNLTNSFKIKKNFNLKNRTIILVDDVTTTGTTLKECAKILKAAGAKEIWGLVVARG